MPTTDDRPQPHQLRLEHQASSRHSCPWWMARGLSPGLQEKRAGGEDSVLKLGQLSAVGADKRAASCGDGCFMAH